MKLSDFYKKNGELRHYAIIKNPRNGFYDIIKLNSHTTWIDKKQAQRIARAVGEYGLIGEEAEELKQSYIEKRSK